MIEGSAFAPGPATQCCVDVARTSPAGTVPGGARGQCTTPAPPEREKQEEKASPSE